MDKSLHFSCSHGDLDEDIQVGVGLSGIFMQPVACYHCHELLNHETDLREGSYDEVEHEGDEQALIKGAKCPRCGQQLTALAQLPGESFPCPLCDGVVTVTLAVVS
jgi:uncharacterized CHY-type Zn-finger protein